MRLKFKAPYLSVQQLESIDLPLFTLLTGLNGSGKTHILKAIKQGNIIIEGIPQHRIKFFSYLDFKIAEGSLNSQQIEQETTQAWKILSGTQGHGQRNWILIAKKYYDQFFPSHKTNELNLNFFNIENQMYKPDNLNVISYIKRIQDDIFGNNQFKQYQYSPSIIKAIKKINKPLHLINEKEFRRTFIPSIPEDNHLSVRLGAVFTKYKTDQFHWIHEEWEKRNTNIDRSSLEKEYEKSNSKPWKLIDEILSKINNYSLDKSVFNFQITNPEKDKLNLRSWSDYNFNPQLIDVKTKQPRSFDALSSGECVLLALAISIYESNENF